MKKFIQTSILSVVLLGTMIQYPVKQITNPIIKELDGICQTLQPYKKDTLQKEVMLETIFNNLEIDKKTYSSIINKCLAFLETNTSNQAITPKEDVEIRAKNKVDSLSTIYNLDDLTTNETLKKTLIKMLKTMTEDSIKKELVNFLYQLKFIYGSKFMKYGLNQIIYDPINMEGVISPGVGYVSYNKHPYASCIQIIGDDAFNTKKIKMLYDRAFMSTKSNIHVVTHEYGHVLSGFVGLNQEQKNTINRTSKIFKCESLQVEDIGPDKKMVFTKNASNKLAKSLISKFNIRNELARKIFLTIFSISEYGITNFSSGMVQFNAEYSEWFAELFTYWILTPRKGYTMRWNLLNNFLIHDIKQWI